MDFAKNILGKYGWKEGDGLGKNNDGISKALKPNYKFDKTGLGHNKADEFNNHWWDSLYKNASNNLDVNKNEAGEVKLGLITGQSISINTQLSQKLKNKNSHHYGNKFLRTSTLVSSGQEIEHSKKDKVDTIPPTIINIVSDEELLRACNGRTAHKGARHGLKLSGKLARIEAQERELMEKLKLLQSLPSTSKGSKREQEITEKWVEACTRKHKTKSLYKSELSSAQRTSATTTSSAPRLDEDDKRVNDLLYQNEYFISSKKKRKQQEKIDRELSLALASISTGQPKSKKHKTKQSNDTSNEPNWHTVADESKAIKKKSKKHSRHHSKLPKCVSGAKNEFIKKLPIEKIQISFDKKSRKRKRDTNDDNISLNSYRDKSDEDVDSTNHSDDSCSVTTAISKKLKSKLGLITKKNKKIIIDNLTDFQKDHFKKSGLPYVEIKTISTRRIKEDQNRSRSLANKMDESMNLEN